MESALGSCIHAAIYDNIIRHHLLWQTPLAKRLGIALPERKPNTLLGSTGLFHLSQTPKPKKGLPYTPPHVQQLGVMFKVLTRHLPMLSSPPFTPNTHVTGVRKGKRKERHRKRPRQRLRRRDNDISLQRIHLLQSICMNVKNTAIHILHDCKVDREEMLILGLGLNFVPPPHKCNYFFLNEAVNKFTRRIRIKKHFLSQQRYSSPDNTAESNLHLRITRSLTTSQAQAHFDPPITNSPIEHYIKTATAKVLSRTN